MIQQLSCTEGTDASTPLGFVAQSVLIENYSQSWAWIPAAQRFCPPLRTMQCALTQRTDIGEVDWRNPPGNIQPTPQGSPLGVLNAFWSDQAAQNTTPQSIYVGQTGASVISSGTAIATNTFAIPQGTIALGVDTSSAGGETLSLTGQQSGTIYCNNEFVKASDGVLVFPVDPIDTGAVFTSSASLGRCLAFPFTPPMPIQPGTLDLPVFTKGAGENVGGAAGTVGAILAGSSSVDGTTLITVPTNHIWKGTVGVSGTSNSASGSAPDVEIGTTSGAGANPAAGVMLAVAQVAQNAAGATGDSGSAVSSNVYVKAGNGAGGTTIIVKTRSATAATGWCNGVLVA